MTAMTPRARVRAALKGKECDRVPFTIYQMLLPRGDVERRLRDEGLALIGRIPAYRVELPNVQVFTMRSSEVGKENLEWLDAQCWNY